MIPASLPTLLFEDRVRQALLEDLGRGGDLTSSAVIPAQQQASAQLICRQGGRIAGLEAAATAFRILDPDVSFQKMAADGDEVEAGTVVATVAGSARAVLTAERTALNFFGHLCGIATATRDLVREVESGALPGQQPPAVVCTRKTTPLLRDLEKYAVRCGGGANHRFGLDDAVMIKDNHIAVAGSLAEAVARARRGVGHTVKIELEVDTAEQLEEALALPSPDATGHRPPVDIVLLDNFYRPGADGAPGDLGPLRRAVVRLREDGRGILAEASGGIGPQSAAAVAATGVDLLSVGWITHSAPRLDVALDIVTP
ncbi:MAG: carboxylating nicotinate-nucleotide diphosphorylase [Acidobacteriota bacterium]